MYGYGFVARFLGRFGFRPGKCDGPEDVHFSPDGKYIYVADNLNYRNEYFKWVNVAVMPASLGCVKALFR